MKGLNDPHAYAPATVRDSRSPCPALNALANHGYLPRSGTHITLPTLIRSITKVYNFTYVLSILLALVGFLACGRLSRIPADPSAPLYRRIISQLIPRWTLDLSALSKRTGFLHIAHDGSLVHPDGKPSSSPDPALLAALLASPHTKSRDRDGFTLADLARVQAWRRKSLAKPLDTIHEEIACGECGLLWMAMGEHEDSQRGDLSAVVPVQKVRQWLGEERLPVGWARPVKPIGIIEARARSLQVKKVEAGEGVF
ncbi:Chloroperoxidase [Cyathus striatus]|nr:Chloroperoxidase [Cyathus striatus]